MNMVSDFRERESGGGRKHGEGVGEMAISYANMPSMAALICSFALAFAGLLD